MKIILGLACVLTAVPEAAGQSATKKKTSPTTGTRQVLEETSRVLREARSNRDAEAVRGAADRAADGGALDRLASEARKKLQRGAGSEEKEMVDAVDRKLDPALKTVAPEGQALIAQSAAAPALRAPTGEEIVGVAKAVPVEAPAPGAPVAAPSPPKSGGQAKAVDAAGAKKSSEIDIKSEGALFFDSAQALAVFTDDVVVNHPQFHMTSDKLEVYFVKEAEGEKKPEAESGVQPAAKEAGAKEAAAPAPAPAAKEEASEDAKVRQAIATGRKVVIQKLDEKGEMQIGICRHATYVGSSGDIILRQMPQVQRGNNVIIARVPSTYMVLKQNGELKVYGPADTKIEQKPDPSGRPRPPGLAPAGDAPGPPVLTPRKTAQQ